jgi:tellurite resistance protein TehA-like permease
MVTQSPVPSTAPGKALHLFHPGWYGAVMGTAIVGVAASMNPGGLPGLKAPLGTLGVVMLVLAYLVAVVLGVPNLLRWVHHPDAALRDLSHPVVGALYATFPGGILVLATATVAVGPAILPQGVLFPLVAALATVGGLLAFSASVVLAYILFVTPSVGVETTNGGWFIPPVVNIIVPMGLIPLIPNVDASTGRLLLVASFATWGIGFLLSS